MVVTVVVVLVLFVVAAVTAPRVVGGAVAGAGEETLIYNHNMYVVEVCPVSASGVIEDFYMTEARAQSFHGIQIKHEVPQLNQRVIFTEWHVYKYSYIIYAFFYTIDHVLSFSLELRVCLTDCLFFGAF